eukprot:5948667-Alexandrium_andersonii.AAC.1
MNAPDCPQEPSNPTRREERLRTAAILFHERAPRLPDVQTVVEQLDEVQEEAPGHDNRAVPVGAEVQQVRNCRRDVADFHRV